ncbi:MAG: hypothetical protein ACFE85_07415 [Candidatus Hodarchaeota archaeon]
MSLETIKKKKMMIDNIFEIFDVHMHSYRRFLNPGGDIIDFMVYLYSLAIPKSFLLF